MCHYYLQFRGRLASGFADLVMRTTCQPVCLYVNRLN